MAEKSVFRGLMVSLFWFGTLLAGCVGLGQGTYQQWRLPQMDRTRGPGGPVPDSLSSIPKKSGTEKGKGSNGVELGAPGELPESITTRKPAEPIPSRERRERSSIPRTVPESASDPEGLDLPAPDNSGVELLPSPRGPQVPGSEQPGPEVEGGPAKLKIVATGKTAVSQGQDAQFTLKVINESEQLAEDVAITCGFGPGLRFEESGERKLTQRIGDVEAGKSKDVNLSLTAISPGTSEVKFEVTSRGRVVGNDSLSVKVEDRPIEVRIDGPSSRPQHGRAEFIATLQNLTNETIENVVASVNHDAAVTAREASTGVKQRNGGLQWELGKLGPKERVQIQVEFECLLKSEHACVTFSASGENVATMSQQACLRIEPAPEAIRVLIEDTADPVFVKDEFEYMVTVENAGLQEVSGVGVTVEIPSLVEFISASNEMNGKESDLKHQQDGKKLVFEPIARMAADEKRTFVVRVRAKGAGNEGAKITVTTSENDKGETYEEPTVINH